MGEGRRRQLGARGLTDREQALDATARGERCTVCDQRPSGPFVLSHQGQITCARHPAAVRCHLCGRPDPMGDRGWTDLGNGVLRCPRCAVAAIEDVDRIREQMPAVRAGISAIGFTLSRRVKVRLVTAHELRAVCPEGGPTMFGVTRVARWANGRAEALDVVILRGLPPLWFGRTIVHENMHAWLAQQGIEARSPIVEEGMCELAAFGWLARQQEPFAQVLRHLMRSSSDPVYGAGLHLVQAAVAAHGLPPVIDHLRRTGDLPAPRP